MEKKEEFRVTITDFSDLYGNTDFNTDLKFIQCQTGSAMISINSIEHCLTAQHSFILSEYMTFKVRETSTDFLATVITISLPFYYEIVAGFDGAIFNVLFNSAPELYESSDLQSANLIFENLCLLYKNSKHTNRRAMAMNLVACYIYEIYELTLPHINAGTEKNRNTLFAGTIFSLYGLITKYYDTNRNIEFYAEKLNMSSRYLYKIIQSTCHITPKQLIDDVVISLVKQALLTTVLNNQQISEKFGFSDQSTFGQYFKRCTKLSPSEFRQRNK